MYKMRTIYRNIRLSLRFLPFPKEIMHHSFSFILFYRITYDPFCSIAIKTATFDRLGFTLVNITIAE